VLPVQCGYLTLINEFQLSRRRPRIDPVNFVRKALVRLLSGLASPPARLARCIELGKRRSAYNAWVADRGDLIKRLDYALGSDAVVWDVGGYEGQWASDIVARFGCRVHVFEPAWQASEFIRRRFAANPLVTIHNFALGDTEEETKLNLAGDGSSMIIEPSRSEVEKIIVRDIVGVWRELGATRIDLMKINIEGEEYDLLNRLIDTNTITKISDVQVQFHDFVPNAERRRKQIGTALERTHVRTWCYDFVWENWHVRGGGVR
jgi:FkbM family methyltransferase